MKKRFILIGFSSYSRLKLLQKARTISKSMTDNPKFPNPQPTIATLDAAADAYESALSDPNGKDKTAQRDECAAVLIPIMQQLGRWVQANSFNNETIMLSSGYDISKIHGKFGPLPPPEDLKVIPLSNGAVKLRVKKVKGAKSYLFEYSLITDGKAGDWQVFPSSKTSAVIRNLVSGAQYNFRVAAVGADPVLTYSNVVSSFML